MGLQLNRSSIPLSRDIVPIGKTFSRIGNGLPNQILFKRHIDILILLGRNCNAYHIIGSYVTDHVGFRGRDDSSSSRYKLEHLQDLNSSGKRRSI